ncbi:MAG: NAD(P)-binding protein [Bacillota bacterium]
MAADRKNKVGAALVVGGGIAGMQASLDLAESGFYVYLVEKSPSIGGTMARLDKTFPTNDCAMCILSPKLVECGRHLNIESLTNAEVLDIEGTEGQFKVKIRQNPRYIDLSKCTGCGDCEKACPVRVKNQYEYGLGERKAVFRPFPQAYPNAFSIEKKDRALCTVSCPAGVHAQGYVALIRDGKFKEAVRLVKRNNPLPAICGRVCHHPCEASCKRGLIDDPIAICHLKRFIADYEYERGVCVDPEPKPSRGVKVAVVGSGPAGLTCAYDLALEGFDVTVFEALPVAGGMLTVGIPPYRLPKDVIRAEIGAIERLGVEIRCNTALGRDVSLSDLKAQGYRAVFIAVGAHREQRLGIEGEDAAGVLSGVDFLREMNLQKPVKVGESVLVIGGGNVAIDAARSALRLGAKKVTILYRRSRAEMPANEHEVEEAQREGIEIQFLTAPHRVIAENGVARGLECVRMRLGKPDASGRRRPEPIPGSLFTVAGDTIISAIGQVPDLSFADEAPEITDRGRWLKADPDTLETSVPGVFAGGDAVTGPATVVEAVAAGKRAAESILRYLEGRDLREDRVFDKPHMVVGDVPKERAREARKKWPTLPLSERLSGFAEVELPYTAEQAVAEASRCLDCGVCSECLECEAACRANAVMHDDEPVIREIEVGAVVLCPGFEAFDPSPLTQYGYGKYKNVVTSLEFERILSASGPYEGHVVRPSDHRTPKRIAFVQCIGSRDVKEAESYCSSVCCMYAIKEAVIAKEHVSGDLDITIFFMDMRAYGKDFEKYYNRAREEHGVRFVRAKVYGVEEDRSNQNLRVRFTHEDGHMDTEEFDMVVLSVGMRPKADTVELAKRVGLHLDEHNYVLSSGVAAVATSTPGIFVSGAFAGPKDIPETVMEASAAAAAVGSVLAPERFTRVSAKQYPKERDVRNKRPRIGVFVCHCGINIGGVVRVPEIVEYARTLPYVVYAEENLYTCSQDTQDKIKALIEEHDLNRIVVASCSPRTHEPLFQQTIREAGLNPYLFEMANIRDQCSWVHMHEPAAATRKAKDLVAMAVAKAARLEPLKRHKVPVIQKAMVIGGGPAGMTAALGFADQGYPVYLVEREDSLGGNLKKLAKSLEGTDYKKLLSELVDRVSNNELVTVYTGAEIEAIDGFVGNFKTTLSVRGEKVSFEHGAVVVATGGKEYEPTEYLYGTDDRVMTQTQLEQRLAKGALPGRRVVMIQCVGSREPERPYCSRVCCGQAVKNALDILAADPSAEVTVLYRDMRTYGLKEDYYRAAREAGVTFIRYDDQAKPVVQALDGRLTVRVHDAVSGCDAEMDADCVVLGAAIVPHDDSKAVAQLLKVPVNDDRFFLEAHVKLRPVDFATDGVFVAGLAHAPKTVSESISQAMAAVGRAVTVISKESIEAGGIVASVIENRCTGCGACEQLCVFSAIRVNPDKKVAEVESAVCKGCGSCAANCRCGAIVLRGFTEEQILAEVAALPW